MNRHRIIIATQCLAMMQAIILSVLSFTGAVQVWHIISLGLFLGIINAFDMPARQSFVLDMIEHREDLSNAIALNSSMFNAARLVGPAIAGLTIGVLGEGACFVLNAISYIPVIMALSAMKLAPVVATPNRRGVIPEFREGLSYVARSAPISTILLFVAVVSIVGMQYTVLMPVMAKDILQGGPNTFGFLMGSTGVGAVIGALTLASRKTVVGLGRWIPIAGGIFGAGLVALALSRSLSLSMALLLLTGFGMMVQLASSNTILQTIADDDKRGRVMSFYVMAFMGMAPFGSLLAGWIASTYGAPATLAASGCVCMAGALVFATRLPSLRKEIRPIYSRLGIIPEVSTGVQVATHITMPPSGE
jgi:MFS family permease